MNEACRYFSLEVIGDRAYPACLIRQDITFYGERCAFATNSICSTEAKDPRVLKEGRDDHI